MYVPRKQRSAWSVFWFLLLIILIVATLFVGFRMQRGTKARETDLYARISEFYKQGKYAEAEVLSKELLSVQEAQKKPDDVELIPYINQLATIHQKQDHHEQAEALFRRALKIREKDGGPEDPRLLYALNSIAEIQLATHHLPEAEETCLRALDIRTKIAGVIPLEIGRTLRIMADLLMAKEKPAEAEHYYKESINHYDAHLKADEAVEVMEKLAEYYRKAGRLPEANQLMERVYDIRVNRRQ